jgi:hypothetical protein
MKRYNNNIKIAKVIGKLNSSSISMLSSGIGVSGVVDIAV